MTFPRDYYKNLSSEEFMKDTFFIRSIKSPDEETKQFWEAFLLEYPHQQKVFDETSSLIREIKFKKDLPVAGAKEKVWNNITSNSLTTANVVKIKAGKRWLWAAAAIAGIILISVSWFLMKDNTSIKNQTAYGEVKKVILPDQSVVTLNANSTLEYPQKWSEGSPREIWLKGEAFFDIKHLNKDGQPVKEFERFIVHAGDATVEVLGTSFNVSNRKAYTQVVLKTGSVKIDFAQKGNASITMQPGESVKYNQETKEVVKESVETEKYISWKQKELMLNNTTVQDVINIIENNFGYKVEVENKDILDRQLSGTATISLEDEKTLFKALELILNVEIITENKTLRIKDR